MGNSDESRDEMNLSARQSRWNRLWAAFPSLVWPLFPVARWDDCQQKCQQIVGFCSERVKPSLLDFLGKAGINASESWHTGAEPYLWSQFLSELSCSMGESRLVGINRRVRGSPDASDLEPISQKLNHVLGLRPSEPRWSLIYAGIGIS